MSSCPPTGCALLWPPSSRVAILVLGKSLGGGNNWFAGYGVFVVLCLIGAFVISRIDDKKESDDAAIEQELLAKAKSHSAK